MVCIHTTSYQHASKLIKITKSYQLEIISHAINWPIQCAPQQRELVCFQGDRGPKGACGGDGPKGEKVSSKIIVGERGYKV